MVASHIIGGSPALLSAGAYLCCCRRELTCVVVVGGALVGLVLLLVVHRHVVVGCCGDCGGGPRGVIQGIGRLRRVAGRGSVRHFRLGLSQAGHTLAVHHHLFLCLLNVNKCHMTFHRRKTTQWKYSIKITNSTFVSSKIRFL